MNTVRWPSYLTNRLISLLGSDTNSLLSTQHHGHGNIYGHLGRLGVITTSIEYVLILRSTGSDHIGPQPVYRITL